MAMNGREANRAEIFEDEKRRIIDSCFAKRDADGSALETYITHIKITEYQTSPTSPPPPSARTPQYEKPRVIIVAVRKSGRVRIHKSKENPNGTFSIGKTWFLDDLTAIESYTSPTVNPNAQQWAGDVGFVVALGKPYYWQAQTDKEKKFFIASLIKIYNKYTGGRNPTLTGFEQRELEQVLGGAQVPRRQERPPPRPTPLDTAPSSANPSVSSGYNAPLSAQGTPAPVFAERMASRSPMVANGKSSPAQSIDTGRPSQEQQSLRRLAHSNKSQDSVAASSITRSEDASSLRPSTRNGMNGASPYVTPEPTPLPASEEKPPERKRPPMDPMRPLQVDKNLIPAPLMSPGLRREPMVPPRNVERISPRKDSISRRNEPATRAEQVTTPRETNRPDITGRSPSPAVSTPPSAPPTSAIPPIPTPPVDKTSPAPPPEPQEDTKPGLGPMIKKKSKGEIAGAFWKAASAASAFKPRPGGAAERLRSNQNKNSDEPDGITSVVPAPPKPVQKPPEPAPAVEPPPKAADRNATPSIPEVKITESDSTTKPGTSQPSIKDLKEKKAQEPPVVEEPRRSIVVGNDTKYLATLGIDPSLLDNRTNEFAKWLDYFGWVPGEKMRARNFDEMRTDLDRELSKAQAGGWLARFQEEDERVEAIKRGIDLSISECDELDNLLTLYSVELSVSHFCPKVCSVS